MVVAKNDDAHQELARQFHDREVEKEYVALAWGLVQQRKRIDAAIGRDPKHREKMSTRAGRARHAVTRVTWARDLQGRDAAARRDRHRAHAPDSRAPERASAIPLSAMRSTAASTAACRTRCARCTQADAAVPARRAARLHASAHARAPGVHGAAARGSRGGRRRARAARSVRCGICARAAATGRVRNGDA